MIRFLQKEKLVRKKLHKNVNHVCDWIKALKMFNAF